MNQMRGSLMRVTGLSSRYVWLIRRGGYVPHPRHWEALRSVAQDVQGEWASLEP